MANNEITGMEAEALGHVPVVAEDFFELGMICSSGRSAPVDLVSAHKWFNLAAMKGYQDGARLRREIAAEMSDAEIGMAQVAAREWLKSHPQAPARVETPMRVAA